MFSCAWSPDGTKLATASRNATVRVWDVSTGREVAMLEGHGGKVNSCAWSPNGKRLASASHDKKVRVWLAPTVTPVITDGQANNTTVPDASPEAIVAQLAAANARAGVADSRANDAGTRTEVANTRARRLEGDPEALQGCSLQVGRCLLKLIEIRVETAWF